MRSAVALLLCVVTTPLRAQTYKHDMPMSTGPLGIPETRMGSGTSWLPDASPMHAAHLRLGQWSLMVHGTGALQYDRQGGARGSDQVALLDWIMAALSRPLAGGELQFHGMASTEPWTVGTRGYPLLLQTGESYQGAPLHDRQHPHDLFMELAVLYRRPIAPNLGLSAYLAPVGEPALGPVAFPHRPSAAGDPLAPLSHHWQDGSHITYGVTTLGIFSRRAQLEASLFNGREPDEARKGFDYGGRALDSYSARLTLNPGQRWSLSAWYGYLKSPESIRPAESLRRLGAAALTTRPVGTRGTWSSALIYGANATVGSGRLASSVLLETTVNLDAQTALFGRVEYVEKSAEDLEIATALPTTRYRIGALALGYSRELGTSRGLSLGLGARGAMSLVPAVLEAGYGSRTPVGFAVYLRLRPARPRGDAGMVMDGR